MGEEVDHEGRLAHAENGELPHLSGLEGEVFHFFFIIETHADDVVRFLHGFDDGHHFRQKGIVRPCHVQTPYLASASSAMALRTISRMSSDTGHCLMHRPQPVQAKRPSL